MKAAEEQMEEISERGEAAEIRIFGPPGTGKTTYLGRQATRAAAKYGPDGVMVTSFSKAAAVELLSRDLPVNEKHIGTLHSICLRALGKPPLAQAKGAISDWNLTYPSLRIGERRASDLDEGASDVAAGLGVGDAYLAEANRLRNLLIPLDEWDNLQVCEFYKKWTDWKDCHGLCDFTDLLERCWREVRIAPDHPNVIFADEAQDLTPLQLAVVRQWGRHTDYFVVVVDDDQTIFSFAGASPDAFITPEIPADRKIVLSQSYRVPRHVHALATNWISLVASREPKEYRPADRDGSVAYGMGNGGALPPDTCQGPDRLLDDAERNIAAGKTCMFLVSCSYMLHQVIKRLRDRGIPYWNPYRKLRGDWNPLRGNGTTASDRALALMAAHGDSGRPWTVQEFRAITDWIPSEKLLAHGVKAKLKGLAARAEVTEDNLREWLLPEQFDKLPKLLDGPVHDLIVWWLGNVHDDHRRTAGFPCRVINARGVEALREKPQVIVGTIHSVKGGEADVVYLFPDISQAGDGVWMTPNDSGRDSIIRQFYVGMTRAKERLVICYRSSPYAVPIWSPL